MGVDNLISKRVAWCRFAHWEELDKSFRADVVYMNIAFITASLSKANRAKVGAVIVKDGIVCSSGYNGTPRGTSNCCEYTGNDGHQHTLDLVIHAELNAILNMVISNSGMTVKGSTIYITYSPCPKCAAMIKQVGISRVVFCLPYRDSSGIKFLLENGVDVDQIEYPVMTKFMQKLVDNEIQHK